MKLLITITIPLYLIMNSLHAQTQTFVGEAGLPSCDTDGFYRVLIPPAIAAFASAHYQNLRIVDGQGNEVPYLTQETNAYTMQQFVAYKIVKKEQQSGCCTSLILENTARNTINNLLLQIKNAEVTKAATLSGSDDQKQWYALKERFTLDAISNPHQTSEVRILNFPLSNYAYYRLQINDSTSAPLNIVNAGYYNHKHEGGVYTRLDKVVLDTKEDAEEQKTYCTITLDTAHWVDRITIAASGPPYFLRSAALYRHSVRYDKRGKATRYKEPIAAFDISSTKSTHIDLHQVKAKAFLLVINNEDNPPLHIDSLNVDQLNRYLIAYFKGGHRYTLKVGETTMQQPVYDLAHFRTSIPDDLAIVIPEPFELYRQQISASKSPSIFNNKKIIWIAIAGITVVLALMSFRMIREARVSKDDKDQR